MLTVTARDALAKILAKFGSKNIGLDDCWRCFIHLILPKNL